MKLNSLTLLLTFVMIIVPLSGASEESAAYPIWVDGVQVTDGNMGNVLGDDGATVRFVPAAGDRPAELLLDNASLRTGKGVEMENYSESGVIFSSGDLKIVLMGHNTLTAPDSSWNFTDGVCVYGHLTFAGDGHLDIVSGAGTLGSLGIYAGSVTLSESVVLNVTSGGSPKSRGVATNGFLDVGDDACLNADGGNTGAGNSIGVLVVGHPLTVSGTLTAAGGTGEDSYGILLNEGSMAISGNVTAAGADGGESFGLFIHEGNLTIVDAGTLTASGGGGAESCGVSIVEGSLTIADAGRLSADGGAASRKSCGVSIEGGALISGSGFLTASGGKADEYSFGADVSDRLCVSDTASLIVQGGTQAMTSAPDLSAYTLPVVMAGDAPPGRPVADPLSSTYHSQRYVRLASGAETPTTSSSSGGGGTGRAQIMDNAAAPTDWPSQQPAPTPEMSAGPAETSPEVSTRPAPSASPDGDNEKKTPGIGFLGFAVGLAAAGLLTRRKI